MAADKIIRNSKLDTFLSKLATKLTAIFWRKAETTQVSIDSSPTANSNNLVKSGGVKTYVDGAIPDVSGKENASNKVTSLSSQSTDTQYPSAKCVYDELDLRPKAYLCTDEAEYKAIANPDSKTLYLIPKI